MRELTTQSFNLDDETAEKRALRTPQGRTFEASHASEGKSFLSPGNNLARCIQAGGHNVIGQSRIREKDDPGLNHAAIQQRIFWGNPLQHLSFLAGNMHFEWVLPGTTTEYEYLD